MLVPTELRGNIGPSLLTLGPDVGRALKKLAKRMLMATRTGLEPVFSAVTVRCDSQNFTNEPYVILVARVGLEPTKS